MQNGDCTKESNEPKQVLITIRLIEDNSSSMQEKPIKVLPKVHVSHLLKALPWTFNKSGFYAQDFEAFLIRDDGEVQLDQKKKICEYGIQNQNSIVEIRRKNLVVTLKINIHKGDLRDYQVNASLPVYETVKFLGSKLGVENTKELSLALPELQEKSRASITSINWLDPVKSLNAQGVVSGDTVLLRKKFFIFNEDIGEAERNPVLRELLLNQFQTQILIPDTQGVKKTYQSCSYGIPSETSDIESLSDHEGSMETFSFMSEVMKSLEQSKNESSSEITTVNEEWMQTLSKHKDKNSFFPVKCETQSEVQYLCVKSSGVYLTKEARFNEEYMQKWSVEEITTWEKSSENHLKIIVDGTSHGFSSDHMNQILEHLDHLSFVTEKEASGSKHENSPITRPSLSPAISIPSSFEDLSRESSPELKEDAGIGHTRESVSSGAEPISTRYDCSLSPSHSPAMKKEKLTNIAPPAYFGLSYKELLETHMLLHIIILDQEIREILVDVTQPVRNVIREICATYGIQYPEDHFLRHSESTKEILQTYGGKPRLDSLSGKFVESSNPTKYDTVLKADQPMIEQLPFDMQPIILLLRRHNFDEIDAVQKYSLDIGSEWPDGEDPGVARYRLFYQSWMSVVNGNRDIDRHTAVRLAGILTYLYHGSRKTAPFWPPLDFNPKCFLPEKFQNVIGIEKDVLKFHRKYGEVDLKDAIEEVIKTIKEVPYFNGIQFTVKVPVKSEILRLRKMEQRKLCVSRDGIVCFPTEGKKTKCFKGQYSDIHNWATSEASFRLSFGGSDESDFYAYTYQSKQIMEMMQIYVKMAYNKFQMHPESKVVNMSDV